MAHSTRVAPRIRTKPVLDFLLFYLPLSGNFKMRGGPLERTFDQAEWEEFVSQQGTSWRWYEEWAEEAKLSPDGYAIRKI